MKINICQKEDVKKIGDSYVIPTDALFYKDLLIVKSDNGVYIVAGFFDGFDFTLLDDETSTLAAFVPRNMSIPLDDIIHQLENEDDLPNGVSFKKFSLD